MMYGKKGQKKRQTKGKKTPTVSLNESDEEPQVLRENEREKCGTCNEDCEVTPLSAVLCSKCKLWYHANCQRLKTNEMKILAGKYSDYYLCEECTNLNGHFDYDSSLLRLELSPSAAKLEKIFLRNNPLTSGSKVFELDIDGKKKDEISKNIVSSVGGASGRKPAWVSSEGSNSIFNALSVAIYGDESYAKELRVRTYIELSARKKFYKAEYDTSGLNIETKVKESKEFKTFEEFRKSSLDFIQAAATVLQRNIKSVFPAGSDKYECVKVLNRLFTPRGKIRTGKCPTVYIMWTSTSPKQNESWTPNHFVPLLQVCDPVIAAKRLVELKENMKIIPDPDPDGMIKPLQPGEDGYKKLKYFKGNMTNRVKKKFQKHQYMTEVQDDGASAPKPERDGGAATGPQAGQGLHYELQKHIENQSAESTRQPVKDIVEEAKSCFRKYENPNPKNDNSKEQWELDLLQSEFPLVGYMIHEIKNERPDIYFWKGNADAIGWYKDNYVIIEWKVVVAPTFWKKSDAYGKYLYQCLVYAWLLKLHFGLRKLPYILIVPIDGVTQKVIEPGLFYDFPIECTAKLDEYKWSTNLDQSKSKVSMSLPRKLIQDVNIDANSCVDKNIKLCNLFKPGYIIKELLDPLGRSNLKVEP